MLEVGRYYIVDFEDFYWGYELRNDVGNFQKLWRLGYRLFQEVLVIVFFGFLIFRIIIE